jgi:hypothetical protein
MNQHLMFQNQTPLTAWWYGTLTLGNSRDAWDLFRALVQVDGSLIGRMQHLPTGLFL